MHPDYRRRGVGAALFDWGIQSAERDGLAVYLEATAAGLPLYEKFGGVVKASSELLEGKYTFTYMLREPSHHV